ncbi:hypothetical protein [Fusobacterium polymorphum]
MNFGESEFGSKVFKLRKWFWVIDFEWCFYIIFRGCEGRLNLYRKVVDKE